MRLLLLIIFYLFALPGCGQRQLTIKDTSIEKKVTYRIDSFVNTFPSIPVQSIVTFLQNFKYDKSQTELALFERPDGSEEVVSKYRTKGFDDSYMQGDKKAYDSKDKKTLALLQYMHDVSLTSFSDYIHSQEFKNDKKIIDSLIQFEKEDTINAYYHYVLGRIYEIDIHKNPETITQAYYHFNRGRFYLENYKLSLNQATNEPPQFSKKEKETKYPTLVWSRILFELYQGIARTLHNSTNIDPANNFKRFTEEKHYFTFLAESININSYKNGAVTKEIFLFNQQKSLRRLTEIPNKDISTEPDSVYTKSFVSFILNDRLPHFNTNQDYIQDFLTLYYLAQYLYNNKAYDKALKIYLHALKYKVEHFVPDNSLYFEREALIKMILLCCSKCSITTEDITSFYIASKVLQQNAREHRPLYVYRFKLNEYDIGFDEIHEIVYMLAKKDSGKVAPLIYIYLINIHSTLVKKEKEEYFLLAGPVLENILFAVSLLSKDEKESFYFTKIKPRKMNTNTDEYFESILLGRSLFNGYRNSDVFKHRFEVAQQRFAGELNDELKIKLQKEENRKVFSYWIVGVLIFSILFLLARNFTNTLKFKEKIAEQKLLNDSALTHDMLSPIGQIAIKLLGAKVGNAINEKKYNEALIFSKKISKYFKSNHELKEISLCTIKQELALAFEYLEVLKLSNNNDFMYNVTLIGFTDNIYAIEIPKHNLVNFLSNAYKHGRNNADINSVNITITAEVVIKHIIITVKDDAGGFESLNLENKEDTRGLKLVMRQVKNYNSIKRNLFIIKFSENSITNIVKKNKKIGTQVVYEIIKK